VHTKEWPIKLGPSRDYLGQAVDRSVHATLQYHILSVVVRVCVYKINLIVTMLQYSFVNWILQGSIHFMCYLFVDIQKCLHLFLFDNFLCT